MNRISQRVFLLLVLAQGAHASEEYTGRLFEVFAPAGYISHLVADDPAVGFAIANVAFVIFGLWCYLFPIRLGWSSARDWAWLWIVIELANGVVHTGLALYSGGYFAGAITAPALFFIAIGLMVLMLKGDPTLARREE